MIGSARDTAERARPSAVTATFTSSLDTELPDLHEPTKAQLEAAMKAHVVAQAELVGVYQTGG
jgi:hypothetical protein